MTMDLVKDGGIDEGLDPIEELPHDELAKIDDVAAEATTEPIAPQTRHLALGAASETFCGLPKVGLLTAHPSKAKRTDCLACRDAYRTGKGNKTAPRADAAFKTGDKVEFLDGSAWSVESVNKSGANVKCVIASAANAKGKHLVISATSPLRIFTAEEFEMARVAAEPKPETTTTADGTSKPVRAASGTPVWKPTKADIDKVKELRASGMAYMKIEQAMGWPDSHGNRPFRIIGGAWNYDLLKEK